MHAKDAMLHKKPPVFPKQYSRCKPVREGECETAGKEKLNLRLL